MRVGVRSHMTDIDGNDYIDYMMALLPVVLGYADPLVDAAVLTDGKGCQPVAVWPA